MKNEHLSLEQLTKYSYGDPETAETPMIKRCLEAHKIPVNKLSNEQIRLLIGQGIGHEYLISIAIEKLKVDMAIQATFFPYDLLCVVLKSVKKDFWIEHFDQYLVIEKMLLDDPMSTKEIIDDDYLKQSFDIFIANKPTKRELKDRRREKKI